MLGSYILTDIDSRHNRCHSDSGTTVRAQQDEWPHRTSFHDTPQHPLPGLMNLGAPSHTPGTAAPSPSFSLLSGWKVLR